LLDDDTGKTVSWLSQPDKALAGAVLGALAKDLRDELADDLVLAGIARREERKVLGLFRTERLPSADDSYENTLRVRLGEVRVRLAGTAPDNRTGPVIALLHAMDALSQVLDLATRRRPRRARRRSRRATGPTTWSARP